MASMKAPTAAPRGRHLTGGPTDVEYAAVSSTGVYYAVGDSNSSLWSYASGKWTELMTGSQVDSDRGRSQ